MVASKFLEISWIRCPQNWRLILGHLTLVGWVWGLVENKQVCPRDLGLSNAKVLYSFNDSKEDGNMPWIVAVFCAPCVGWLARFCLSTGMMDPTFIAVYRYSAGRNSSWKQRLIFDIWKYWPLKQLLMEEVPHHLGCIKPFESWGKIPSSTGAGYFRSIRCRKFYFETLIDHRTTDFRIGSGTLKPGGDLIKLHSYFVGWFTNHHVF